MDGDGGAGSIVEAVVDACLPKRPRRTSSKSLCRPAEPRLDTACALTERAVDCAGVVGDSVAKMMALREVTNVSREVTAGAESRRVLTQDEAATSSPQA